MSQQDSVLHPDGLFNPLLQFAFTNITSEDFTSYWNSKPFTIKAGDTVKLTHHLAVKCLKELVDKIMQGAIKLNETEYYAKNPNAIANTYRAPNNLGSPLARKVWEDQIIKQLPNKADGVELEIMRQEFIEGIERDTNAKVSTDPVPVPAATLSHSDNPTQLPKEFAEL